MSHWHRKGLSLTRGCRSCIGADADRRCGVAADRLARPRGSVLLQAQPFVFPDARGGARLDDQEVTIDGGFGEYATAYGRYVVRVPEGVDPFDAAPLTRAGVTTYKAVKVGGTRSSDLVAVFGIGGLGHLALQYVAIAGGRVIAVDVHDKKLAPPGDG